MERVWEGVYLNNFLTKYNPFFMKDMGKALERIVYAVNNREKIVIYGAYSLDSICGVTILLMLLKFLKADVEYYIPDYTEDSNVISVEKIEKNIRCLGTKLLVTVGCTIYDEQDVEYIKSLNMDLIITSNAEIEPVMETIVLNPIHKNSGYGFKELSACGVVFKYAQAISMYYNTKFTSKLTELVMLGTFASNVDLIDENLLFCEAGIKKLKNTNFIGIKCLLNAGINKKLNINEINLEDLEILIQTLTPKLNAVGKMDNARIVVELFTTNNEDRAFQIAKYFKQQSKIKKNDSFPYVKIMECIPS